MSTSPTSSAARRPAPWAALAALLALFLGLHTLYNLSIPLGEGPDEPGHLAYVFFLAREGRLPVQQADSARSDVPGEGHQPPLAYLLAAPAALALPADERVVTLSADPGFIWAGGDSPAAFRRGSRELWPWQGIAPAWHLARAFSGLWGAATVALTYLAARALRPDSPGFALLAAALVALNPQFLFSSALVSNDALLAALAAAALWLCLRPGSGTRRFFALGLLFGLALITKQSALLLGPLLLWASWRASAGDLRRLTALCLTWGLTALAVAGWWFLRNWQLYGDPLGLAVFKAEFTTQPFAWREPAAWLAALGQLFGSFWGRFGWMSVPAPAWATWAYAALCALALAGWLAGGGRRSGQGWAGPLVVLAMALLWTVSFAFTAGLVAWQGRMLFPAIAAAAMLLAAGLQALAGALRLPAAVLPVALGAPLLGLALWMPAGAIAPAYRWDVLSPAAARAAIATPAYARYAQSWERGVELRGWRADTLARPGESLELTLVWHSLEPVPRSWTVFVHLVDAAGTIVAESNSRPRGGALPFTLWTPGDWVDDTHRLELRPDLPPGDYRLIVGLYRPEKDGARQGVWDEAGDLIGDSAEVGMLPIRD